MQRQQNGATADRHQHDGKPFRLKSFYLDLKGFHGMKSLIDDLQLLGGTVEPFLSKEISCVITDKLDGKSEQINNQTIGISSPQNISSAGSFHKPESPVVDGEKPPKLTIQSRGQAIRAKAIKADVNGTSDVIHNAHKWGVAIRQLNKFLPLVEDYKAKLRKQNLVESEKKRSRSGVQLKSPFIKVEATDRQFSPITCEFPRWPKFPFIPYRSENEKLQTTEVTAALVKKKQEVLPKGKDSYCEICLSSFNDLQKHLQCEKHLRCIERKIDYAQFDALVSDGYSLNDYLTLISTDSSSDGQVHLISDSSNPTAVDESSADLLVEKSSPSWAIASNQSASGEARVGMSKRRHDNLSTLESAKRVKNESVSPDRDNIQSIYVPDEENLTSEQNNRSSDAKVPMTEVFTPTVGEMNITEDFQAKNSSLLVDSQLCLPD